MRLRLIFGISILLFPQSLLAKTDEQRPNIILIVADYMGYSDIQPYGAKDINTPSLNALAEQGVIFKDHYTTAASCIPARASLMSGKYPATVLEGFEHSRGRGLKVDNNHLLQGLKEVGYSTALIGKWHLGSEVGFHPNDHGFDYFLGFDNWTLGYHTHRTSDGEPGLYRNKVLISEPGYLTDIFTREAQQFISRSDDNPFFLYLSYNVGLPPYQRPDLAKTEWNTGWDANLASRGDYVAMVERMDLGIGKVLATLKKRGMEKNTLVIFTYDHGGRHLVDSTPLFHGFGTLWEGGIRVPLIIRWPEKLVANGKISVPSIATDLTVTMLQAAQLGSKPLNLDGVDLLSIIQGPRAFKDRLLYWQQGRMKAIRKNHWKYVVDGYTQMLFNLKQDIGERENLFYQHPIIVNELKDQLQKWEEDQDVDK